MLWFSPRSDFAPWRGIFQCLKTPLVVTAAQGCQHQRVEAKDAAEHAGSQEQSFPAQVPSVSAANEQSILCTLGGFFHQHMDLHKANIPDPVHLASTRKKWHLEKTNTKIIPPSK